MCGERENFRGKYMVSYSTWSGCTTGPSFCQASWYNTLVDVKDSLKTHRRQGRPAKAFKYDDEKHDYVSMDI